MNRAATLLLACMMTAVTVLMPVAYAKEEVVVYIHAHWQPHVEKMLNKYQEEHPDVSIRAEYFIVEEYTEKLLMALVGGVMPDIYMFDSTELGRWSSMGMLDDLNKRLPQGAVDHIIPAGRGLGMVEDALLGLPMQMPAYTVWYYNKDLFAQKGADLPEVWDDLFKLAPKFRHLDDAAPEHLLGLHIGDGGESAWRNWQYLWQNGTDALTPDLKQSNLKDPKVAETLEFLQRLVVEGVVATETTPGGGMFNGFIAHRVGIMVDGVWNLDVMANWEGLNVGMMKAPPVPEYGIRPVVQGSAWMIGLKAGASDLAADVLASLMTTEFDRDRTTRIPPPISIPVLEEWLYSKSDFEFYQNALLYLDYSHPFPAHPETPRIMDIVGHMITRVIQGEYIVQAIDDAHLELTRLLEESSK